MANVEGFSQSGRTTGEAGWDEPAAASVIAGARDRLHDARRQLVQVDRKVRDFVVEHPFASLIGALAVGYAVGRVLRRL